MGQQAYCVLWGSRSNAFIAERISLGHSPTLVIGAGRDALDCMFWACFEHAAAMRIGRKLRIKLLPSRDNPERTCRITIANNPAAVAAGMAPSRAVRFLWRAARKLRNWAIGER